jgi:hypothetical protein
VRAASAKTVTCLTVAQPWGVAYSGGTFKYTVIGTTGSRSAAQVAQLPQTAYHALQAPYAFLGLGRTNNYIELLFVGSTSRVREHYMVLEGVVPNSRVVTLPPHPVRDGEAEGAWRTELFLRPGSWIHWVGAIVVIVLIMLSGVIAGLHVAEKVGSSRFALTTFLRSIAESGRKGEEDGQPPHQLRCPVMLPWIFTCIVAASAYIRFRRLL